MWINKAILVRGKRARGTDKLHCHKNCPVVKMFYETRDPIMPITDQVVNHQPVQVVYRTFIDL